MKLKTLKRIINNISEKHDNAEILIARDGEWNGFNFLNDVVKNLYRRTDFAGEGYEVELFDLEEMSEEIKEGNSKILDFEKVIVLSP